MVKEVETEHQEINLEQMEILQIIEETITLLEVETVLEIITLVEVILQDQALEIEAQELHRAL